MGEKITLLALIISVVMPVNSNIGNPTNVAVVLMFLCIMFSNNLTAKVRVIKQITLVGVLVLISTFVGCLLITGDYYINFRSASYMVRIFVCLNAILIISDVQKVLMLVICLGILASSMAVLQNRFPEILGAITTKYYMSETRYSVFNLESIQTDFVRSVSFFENPTSVGIHSVIMSLMSIYAYKQKAIKRSTLYTCIAIHLLAGGVSLSKAFVASIILIIVSLFSMSIWQTLFIVTLNVIVIWYLYLNLDENILNLFRHTLSSSLKLDQALDGRYMDDAMEMIYSNLLFGYGWVSTNTVINDSMYMAFIYNFGVFGFLLFFYLAIYSIMNWSGKIPLEFFLIILTIIIGGIGANSLIGFRLDVFITACCVVLLMHSKNKSAGTNL